MKSSTALCLCLGALLACGCHHEKPVPTVPEALLGPPVVPVRPARTARAEREQPRPAATPPGASEGSDAKQ